MNLPFATIQVGDEGVAHVLVGVEDEELVGFDPVGLDLYVFDPTAVQSLVSTDPAAVAYGTHVTWDRALCAAANRARKKFPRFAARGAAFPTLPRGVLSGFPAARPALERHRHEVPSIDAITVSAIFAVSTVRTRIEQAEISYKCFGDLYRARGRNVPSAQELRACFVGLQNSKSAMFGDVAVYAATIHAVMQMGYRDRELRSVLALDTALPNGLGLAKLSFTLALLGQDCICLDARLLSLLFTDKAKRAEFESTIGKEGGRVSERALLVYEAAEDAFLKGNRFYDARDPIGRARAQWMSWEAVGGKGAKHSVWLELLPEVSR